MMAVQAFEYEEHDWGSSPKNKHLVSADEALALLQNFPSKESIKASSCFGRRPKLGFWLNANDQCSLEHNEDGTFTFSFFYQAATYTRYDASRLDTERLLASYLGEPHFRLFRSLARSDSGLTLFGSTLRARLLNFVIGM